MVKKAPVPCTKEEMDALINATMGDDYSYLLFSVARKTGRRLGEYYDVQVKDFDAENMIMLTKVLKRKQKISKQAILDDNLVYLIQRHISRCALKLDDYIFRWQKKDKPIGMRQIQNKVKTYSKKAEIPHNVSFHNFRHYFITELFKAGWSYERISKLTGHSSIGTLAIYDHSVAADIADDARDAIRNL